MALRFLLSGELWEEKQQLKEREKRLREALGNIVRRANMREGICNDIIYIAEQTLEEKK